MTPREHPPARAYRWARDSLTGASGYLESVFVGVLTVPVLPDIAVDLFGDDSPAWRDPLLRAVAVILALALSIAVFRIRRRAMDRRLAARGRLHAIRHYETLVLPLSPTSVYTAPDRRDGGDLSVPDLLVDLVEPDLVVAVATPQTPAEHLQRMTEHLRLVGVEFTHVTLSAADDPSTVIPEGAALVQHKLTSLDRRGPTVCVDVTGGTVTMSLAMIRAAAAIDADCCYVPSTTVDGRRVPHTQTARSFSPALLTGGDT